MVVEASFHLGRGSSLFGCPLGPASVLFVSHFACFGFPGSSDGKQSACNTGDLGSIPGLERSPGKGNDYPLQYSCLENPMDRGAWQAPVHGVSKSQTQLSD